MHAGIRLGERYDAVAPDACAREESATLLERFYPTLLPWASRVPGHSSLITGARAKEMLDFVPRFTWRDLVAEQ